MSGTTRGDTETLARLIDEADNRWQHGIGSSGYDPDGPPLWIAKAILASDWLAAHDARVRAEALAPIEALHRETQVTVAYSDGKPHHTARCAECDGPAPCPTRRAAMKAKG